MQITETLHIMHCSKSLYTNITPFSQLYKRILPIQQMIQKPPRSPVTETGAVRLHYLYFFKRLRNHLRGFLIAAWAGGKIAGRWESFFPFSIRVLLNTSFCTEQHRLVMPFYFFYFHHTDGKHPIITEVIVE